MKKSTLITTIAMIVVVVVALSTATYAWFSAATTNKVTATVSTQGAGDFALSQATVATPAEQTGVSVLSDWSAAASAITVSNDLMTGLYAPTAELVFANYGIASAAATKGTGKFYLAQSGDNNATAKITNAAAYYIPTVMRIQNTSGAVKQLKAYVDINVGNGTNSANIFAGQSVSFVMICQDASFAHVATITSGYGFGGTVAQGDTTFAVNEVLSTPSTATTSTAAGYTRMGYTGVATDVAAAAVVSADANIGTAVGDYVNTQSVTISSNMANSALIYITLYLWIDGWRADNSAAGANNLKVGIRFYGEAVGE